MLLQKLKAVSFIAVFCVSGCAAATPPSCDGAGQWPASMAFVKLKNAGVVDNDLVDFSKTVVERLESRETKGDMHSQLHRVTFFLKGGETHRVFTVSDATMEECSMGEVEVYADIKLIDNGEKK